MENPNKDEFKKYLPKKNTSQKDNGDAENEYVSPNLLYMKNLGITFLHFIILDMFLAMTFYVQLIGTKDSNKTYKSGSDTLEIFDVNMSFFALGIVLFIMIYFAAYAIFIRKDFIKLSDSPIIWKIFTGFIVFIAIVVLIYEHALIIVFTIGLDVTLNPSGCELIIFYMIFLMLITPFVDLLYSKVLK